MNGRLWAVIGTDTGVGKTVVAAGLARGLRRQSCSVAAFKPVETGLTESQRPGLLPPDAPAPPDWRRLSEATGQPEHTCLGAAFALPAAPLAAARDSNLEVDVYSLEKKLDLLINNNDFIILEGAGGLCVPFSEGLLWADFVQRYSPECLVVGRLGLGTLNHTLLTVLELRRRSLEVLGVILCTLSQPGPEARQTPGLIEELGAVEVLDVVPHGLVDAQPLGERFGDRFLGRLTSQCRTG